MSNTVSHFEIIGTDATALQRFYSQAFGWTLNAEPGAQGYAVVENGGPISGGVGGCPIDGYAGHLTFYIAVDDIAGTLRTLESLGAKTLNGPAELPNGRGRFAHFEDPQGHMVGLVQPAQRAQAAS